jgi:signal transduction histidine kinase
MPSEVSTAGSDLDLSRLVDELKRQLERSTRELAEARDEQTATAGILAAISSSPADLRRVFAEIAASAARLCDGFDAVIFEVEGGSLRLVAHHGPIPTNAPVGQATLPLAHGTSFARAVLDRQTIHVPDIQAETAEYPQGSDIGHRLGIRTVLHQPLICAGKAIGVISIRRTEVRPFTDRQIEVLKTFADQAVIAIESSRQFKEVQVRTADLQESLEQQTATGEILASISASMTDPQPVFDVIVRNVNRLLGTQFANVQLLRDGIVQMPASGGGPRAEELARHYPRPLDHTTVGGQAMLTKQVAQYSLDQGGVAPSATQVFAAGFAISSVLAAPMIHNGRVIGAIGAAREAKPFDDKEVALIKTFADQAVIAIENVRLFEELQARTRELSESLQQQTGTADVLKVISRSAFDLQSVLNTLTESAARLCRANRANIARVHGNSFEFVAFSGFGPEYSEYMKGLQTSKVDRGSITGRSVMEGRTVHVPDVLADPEFTWFEAQKRGGFRTALGVPLMREGTPIGVFILTRSTVAPFTQQEIDLVSTFADQAVIAIENARLFEEVQARTRELAKTVEDLEIASQHKNQFVANMSHELRTPLAAILGYAELIQEGFYEPQGPKSLDALTRICSNGKHLLGLINTVLDIAKIESGQFTLNMSEYAMESVVETVRSATESLAQNKKLSLKIEVAKSLPIGLGDEQRLTQVLLNLVGNAIKFTDLGEVRVTAKAVNGQLNVSVTDTGPGIPPEHQTRIFEQFHQVDSSDTKAKGGTGLGLAIAKQIVEMHGGRIWVESTLGKGSTFHMELPSRAELRKSAP